METKIKTKTKIKVEIDQDVKDLIKSENQEERQVVLHCTSISTAVRVWPSTYLYDKSSSHQSKLISIYNITWGPTWKHFTGDKPACFTLVFSALPKGVTAFDLREILPPQAGLGAPFIACNIIRNKTDVYNIELY